MYRASAFYFFALLLLAVAGFWPSYIRPKRFEADWHVHLHGVAMFLWMLMLVTQATLMRAGARGAHRALGKASFVLVPVIVVSTLLLAHYRMRSGLNKELIYFFCVQLSLLAAFLIAYGGAILNRRTPAVHMRFMACTALALVDPILARLLYIHFGIEPPLLQLITYGAVDLVLVALIIHDRIERHYAAVYQGMLVVFVATQLPTFLVTQTPWWLSFTKAFARLPLP
jgi:hypothetical protein